MIRSDGKIFVPVGAEVEIDTYRGSGRTYLNYRMGELAKTNGSLNDIIRHFRKIKTIYSAEYTDMEVPYMEVPYDTNRIMGWRKAERIEIDWYAEQEAARIAENEKQDREQYERLKEQFEGKS